MFSKTCEKFLNSKSTSIDDDRKTFSFLTQSDFCFGFITWKKKNSKNLNFLKISQSSLRRNKCQIQTVRFIYVAQFF